VTAARRPWSQLTENRQYRWLVAGNTALFFGFFATLLLRSLIAWELTHDEMSLAYINLASAVCMFGVSIVSGVLIDRIERRKMLVIAQSTVFLAETLVLVLLVTDRISFGFLVLSAVAASVAFPFIMPTRTAMLVDAVGKPILGKATAVLTGGINIARMISPAAVGFLVDASGFIYGYLFLISLHFASLLCTLGLKRYPPGNTSREGFMRELVGGYTYLFRKRSLGMALLFSIFPMMIVVPLQNMMVVFVEELWNAGSSGLGIMMTTMGVGGVVGSLIMALLREGSLVKPMILGALCMAVFLLLFANAPGFWWAAVTLMGISGCSVLSQTLVQTAVQLMSDDYIRGRITTITLMSFSLTPIGTVPMAWAVKHLGSQWALTIAAALLILGVLLIWRLSTAFRGIDQAAQV